MIDKDVQVDIQGYDIDPDVVAAARENAKRAGVEHMIHFQQRAVADCITRRSTDLLSQISIR